MLERIQVHVQLYDDIHSKTAQTTIESSGMDLDPGQTNRGRMFFESDHAISIHGVHSAVCTIKSVTFDGGLMWRAGLPWTGKIIKQDASNGNGPETSESSSISSSRRASPAAVTVALGKAWVTNVPNNEPNSGTFVHVRVTLGSPDVEDVWPAEFRMNMTLGNGASKAYSPLQQPAPMVLRGGFLSYTGDPSQLGPSIAPGEDFGAIGKMSLQPNVGVTTVLTYRVDDLGASGSVRSVDFVR